MLNILDRMSEESLAQAPKFLHRIGGEELQARKLPAFFMHGAGQREKPLQTVGDGPSRRFGGIHDAHVRAAPRDAEAA